MYTIIKCQVPEAVNKKKQQKILRQNHKGNRNAEIAVVRDKRQCSQANTYIDNGSALKTHTLRPSFSLVLQLTSPH